MPSVFPGMDPYLEGSLWMSVHTDLAVAIAHQLNRQLLPRYIALTARRYGVPVPHISVEIRDVAKRELVTVIEILSPSNKRGEGIDEYRDRRESILRITAHLIEIDLLRKGRRVPMRGKLPSVSYFVFVCRWERRPATDVWPIALNRSLPIIPVPLRKGDDDANLDLQQALTSVYDEGGLRYMIDYAKAPEVPLTPKQSAWVDQHLRAAGLRP